MVECDTSFLRSRAFYQSFDLLLRQPMQIVVASHGMAVDERSRDRARLRQLEKIVLDIIPITPLVEFDNMDWLIGVLGGKVCLGLLAVRTIRLGEYDDFVIADGAIDELFNGTHIWG